MDEKLALSMADQFIDQMNKAHPGWQNDPEGIRIAIAGVFGAAHEFFGAKPKEVKPSDPDIM